MSFIFPMNYRTGNKLAAAGGTQTFTCGPGQCADSTNAIIMNNPTTFTKTAAAWASGNAGSLDTGSIANNTWYHVHAIDRPDTLVPDVLTSLSLSAPVLPSPYTTTRRIGSMLTDGSGNWKAFYQWDNYFGWVTPVSDVNGTGGTGLANQTLTVPTGLTVRVKFRTSVFENFQGSFGFYCVNFLSLANGDVDQNPESAWADVSVTWNGTFNSLSACGNIERFTNTSAQIGIHQGTQGNGLLFVQTLGWYDPLGQW